MEADRSNLFLILIPKKIEVVLQIPVLLKQQLHFLRELLLVDIEVEFLHLPNINIHRQNEQFLY